MNESNIRLTSAGTGENEPFIVINPDRSITVPEELKKIAIQNDHNIETVTFKCFKLWDNHDLSKMRIFINYLRADNVLDSAICTNIKELGEDEMTFDWVISNNVTMVNGPLTILVSIKEVDAENNVLHRWNSERNIDMYVGEGLIAETEIQKQYSDIITGLLVRMDELEAIGLSHVVNIEETENGYSVTLSDSTGSKTIELLHGPQGPVGPAGEQGNKGSLLEKVHLNEGSATIDPYGKYRIQTKKVDSAIETVSSTRIDTDARQTMFRKNAAIVGNKIYSFGLLFEDTSGNYEGSDRIITVYDIETGTSTYTGNNFAYGLTKAKTAVIGTDIYVFGVCTAGSSSPVWCKFDTVNNNCTEINPTGLSSMEVDSAVAIDNVVYLFSTNYSTGLVSIYKYDPETNKLSSIGSYNIGKNKNMPVAALGDKIYLFPGEKYENIYTSIYEFNTITSDLRIVCSSDTNSINYDVTPIVVGTDIYMFGGYKSSLNHSDYTPTYSDSIQVFDTIRKTIKTLPITLPTLYPDNITCICKHRIALVRDSKIELYSGYLPNDAGTAYDYDLIISLITPYSINTKLSLTDTVGTYAIKADLYDIYFDNLEFEIQTFTISDDGTKLFVAYELNGKRYVEVIEVSDFNIDACTLVIADAEKAFRYCGDEASDGEVTNGTVIKVNGEVVKEFNADTKLDKVTDNANILYGVDHNKEQGIYRLGTAESVSKSGYVPQYLSQGFGSEEVAGYLLTNTPKQPYQAANKKYADNLFNGANKAVSYKNYKTMVEDLNELPADAYKVGQNIYIVTMNVPDLWVSAISEESEKYTYESDVRITDVLALGGTVQFGYFILSPLETQKVVYDNGSILNAPIYNSEDGKTAGSAINIINIQAGDYFRYIGNGSDGLGLEYGTIYRKLEKLTDDVLDYEYKPIDGSGSGGGGTTDVQINGSSITENGVANIPFASTKQHGVMKLGVGGGLFAGGDGTVYIHSAAKEEIKTKVTSYKPISPNTLDYAVKVGMTTNTETWSEEEKANARALIGGLFKHNITIKFMSGDPDNGIELRGRIIKITTYSLNPNPLSRDEILNTKFNFLNGDFIVEGHYYNGFEQCEVFPLYCFNFEESGMFYVIGFMTSDGAVSPSAWEMVQEIEEITDIVG